MNISRGGKSISAARSSFLVLSPLISLLMLTAVAGQRKLDGTAIVRRMAQRYARLSSYRDEGIVVTTYDEQTGGRIQKLPFKTFFKRPRLFRFEWIDYSISKMGRTSVVWFDGKDAFTYWEPDLFEKKEDLGLAIAGATGISNGSAHTVSRLLLMDEVGGFSLTELVGASVVGQEEFEGSLCYHIRGKHPRANPYELWIGKRDLLLRKVRTETKWPDYVTIEEEIRRNIHVDEPIANGVFDFKPPIALTPPKESKPGAALSELFEDEAPTWSEFTSVEGRFKLLMPAQPSSQTLTIESPQGRVEHHSFVATRGAFICILDYADLPKQFGGPTDTKALFDQARDEFLREAQGKLASETTITYEGYPGREMRMDLYGGEARARFVLIEGRFYQLAITRLDRPTKSDDAMDRFFNSFKVTPASKRVAVHKLASPRSVVSNFPKAKRVRLFESLPPFALLPKSQ